MGARPPRRRGEGVQGRQARRPQNLRVPPLRRVGSRLPGGRRAVHHALGAVALFPRPAVGRNHRSHPRGGAALLVRRPRCIREQGPAGEPRLHRAGGLLPVPATLPGRHPGRRSARPGRARWVCELLLPPIPRHRIPEGDGGGIAGRRLDFRQSGFAVTRDRT